MEVFDSIVLVVVLAVCAQLALPFTHASALAKDGVEDVVGVLLVEVHGVKSVLERDVELGLSSVCSKVLMQSFLGYSFSGLLDSRQVLHPDLLVLLIVINALSAQRLRHVDLRLRPFVMVCLDGVLNPVIDFLYFINQLVVSQLV